MSIIFPEKKGGAMEYEFGECDDKCLKVKLAGKLEPDKVFEMYRDIIVKKLELKGVIFDVTRVENKPDVLSTYELIKGLGELSRKHIRLAAVFSKENEITDPFGLTVAENWGISYKRFLDIKSADEWIKNAQ